MTRRSLEHFGRLRETLMNAACACLGDRAWDELTIVEVARAAGVPRQLYYTVFKSRRELGQALVLRESEILMLRVEQALSSRPRDAASGVAAVVGAFLDAAEHNPVIRALMQRDGSAELKALLAAGEPPLPERAHARLAGLLAGSHPDLHPESACLVAELLIRLAVSYQIVPRDGSHLSADTAAELLRPYLEAIGRVSGPRFGGGLEAYAVAAC